MRVNARFEGVAEQQVEYLAATMDISVSEVLRLSVDRLYQSVHSEQPAELRHFGKHIARYNSGQAGTSARYKDVVSGVLDAKYPRQK